jgi:glycosyltransferase involved in cell wall biosynthesis
LSATISVAMCAFNGACFLPQQLKSIATQSRLPDELVVCDDGSSDSSPKLVAEFARSAPFSVRIVRNQTTLGSTRNFEKAIFLCTGELIALCDQDDAWLKNKLARLAQVMEKDSSIGGVFSDAELIDANSNPIGKKLWQIHHFDFARPNGFDRNAAVKQLLKHDVVTGATLMVRASALKFMSPIPGLWVHDGWIAWMLALYSRLSFVNEPLIQYRVHADQQLGVGHRNGLDRPHRPLREDRRKLELMARQFEVLRDRWVSCPGQDYAKFLKMLDDKIAFLRRRSRLPQGFTHRAWAVVHSLSSYERYARGLSSMRGDLFLPAMNDSRQEA